MLIRRIRIAFDMPHYFGIIFALIALFAWGFGDFFIQKTARIIGLGKVLFFIGAVGLFGIFPFIQKEIFSLEPKNWFLLLALGIIVVLSASVNFSALKEGKIAIVEPLIGMEMPITVSFAVILGKEHLSLLQLLLIGIVFIGIVLAVTIHHTHLHYHKRIFEKGVVLAGIGAVCLALTNFLIGKSSQQISPLMAVWFAHSLLFVISAAYLIKNGGFKTLLNDLKSNTGIIIGQSILDNMAWVAFAFATTIIPISIATTISGSYVALAVSLGIFINREKLRKHQIFGIIFAISAIIALSVV